MLTDKSTFSKAQVQDNIRIDLKEIGNWVDSAQDKDYWRAHVNVALNPDNSTHIGFVKMVYHFVSEKI